ncbi:hypothetical protein [Bradyrhizobium sp. CCBAU 51753]|uniref:hypothetical protein n=1 Tax=Bradyrhizobium sp. CCBAU 51753 TaxID=1325100 RepID=UPI00188BAB59|nr:hypothetical protein [Bradyrhizobium sp. CCBAU 51753]QOZ28599.1 hypothetical protein XH93_37345 [Bradyrhizobium sp. CCBAU 51753]
MTIYAQTSGTLTTNSDSFVAIPGLSITIPEGVGITSIIILNVPFPYAQGNNFPGGSFGITVNGVMSGVVTGFTYNEQLPQASGRVPTTLVAGIPLGNTPQTIQAVWSGVRGSTVIIDTPATLTAIMS